MIMGSPSRPMLANNFMCYFEEKWVTTSNARFTGLYIKWAFSHFASTSTKSISFAHFLIVVSTFVPRLFVVTSLVLYPLHDVRKRLLHNGYPHGIITYIVNYVLNIQTNQPYIHGTEDRIIHFVKLCVVCIMFPYIKTASKVIYKARGWDFNDFCSNTTESKENTSQ